MIFQILQCLFIGLKIVISTIIETLPIYNQLSSLKESIISYVIGVPVALVTIGGFVLKLIKKFFDK